MQALMEWWQYGTARFSDCVFFSFNAQLLESFKLGGKRGKEENHLLHLLHRTINRDDRSGNKCTRLHETWAHQVDCDWELLYVQPYGQKHSTMRSRHRLFTNGFKAVQRRSAFESEAIRGFVLMNDGFEVWPCVKSESHYSLSMRGGWRFRWRERELGTTPSPKCYLF